VGRSGPEGFAPHVEFIFVGWLAQKVDRNHKGVGPKQGNTHRGGKKIVNKVGKTYDVLSYSKR